jgi:hypothetical protein
MAFKEELVIAENEVISMVRETVPLVPKLFESCKQRTSCGKDRAGRKIPFT